MTFATTTSGSPIVARHDGREVVYGAGKAGVVYAWDRETRQRFGRRLSGCTETITGRFPGTRSPCARVSSGASRRRWPTPALASSYRSSISACAAAPPATRISSRSTSLRGEPERSSPSTLRPAGALDEGTFRRRRSAARRSRTTSSSSPTYDGRIYALETSDRARPLAGGGTLGDQRLSGRCEGHAHRRSGHRPSRPVELGLRVERVSPCAGRLMPCAVNQPAWRMARSALLFAQSPSRFTIAMSFFFEPFGPYAQAFTSRLSKAKTT